MLNKVVESLLVCFISEVLLDTIYLLLNLVFIETREDRVHLGLLLLHHMGDSGIISLFIRYLVGSRCKVGRLGCWTSEDLPFLSNRVGASL